MCGIVAAVSKDPALVREHAPCVDRILDAMAYRGPDARGMWQAGHIVLGHCRLSIIDLSDAGIQPLHNDELGLHISFNGEIYNYRDLRADLEERGYRFRTSTDTEAILGAYHVYGSRFLEKLRGMFAFILYDEPAQKVLLCRDRMGKKPLYYYFDNERLLACSEIKYLYAFRAVPLSMAYENVRTFFFLQYMPGTATILSGVYKVAPGECLELDMRSWRTASRRYWSITDHLGHQASPDAGIEQVDDMLRESVRYRLIADVEIGILLSGGIDSSLLACYASELSSSPLKAFLVSFDEPGLDESAYATMVARHLNIDLIQINGGRLDASTFRRVMFHADDPLGDPACIPTFMIAEVISRHVKVVLSGEGADELFWGYDYYKKQLLLNRVAPFLFNFRPVKSLDAAMCFLESSPRLSGSVSRLAKVLSASGKMGCTLWTTVFGRPALNRLIPNLSSCMGSRDPLHAMMEETLELIRQRAGLEEASIGLDLMYWLPDDLLVKVDRMSMAHAVEARAPYLDHRLVELALRLPAQQKADFFTTKKILRSLLMQKLPGETGRLIATRKKHGFDVPLARWLGHELKEIADDCFSESMVRSVGFLHYPYVRTLWSDFRRHGGTVQFARKLWLLLCFMTWHEYHKKGFGFR